eukprot:PhF_6_TR22695/c0_g1_i1/m.32317
MVSAGVVTHLQFVRLIQIVFGFFHRRCATTSRPFHLSTSIYMPGPHGITFFNGTLFVTSYSRNSVYAFLTTDQNHERFPERIRHQEVFGNNHLKHPTDVTVVYRDQTIYVADEKSRITGFDLKTLACTRVWQSSIVFYGLHACGGCSILCTSAQGIFLWNTQTELYENIFRLMDEDTTLKGISMNWVGRQLLTSCMNE